MISIVKSKEQQIFTLGDQILDDGISRLQKINFDLNQNNEKINVANQLMVEDEERLMEIGEKINSTMGILREANKYISSIAKSYYKDKCIVGVSILILILIVTVAIVGIVKKQKAKSAAAAAQASTNNTTNTTNSTNSTSNSSSALTVIEFNNNWKERISDYDSLQLLSNTGIFTN